ncbi:etoposide-induced protein 2.4-domain-containing protein [Irpex rosettiformis]|uniref:Etoposide-induced protein 2.4-domain-containing protein n=1 Tax=Irpex rosettiformis TaxID=378272 RepID=A0ACB8TX36_9APHY|nr:etoposide-induced protein 2.4-domain-containing protein [Irpex rosettiformis]
MSRQSSYTGNTAGFAHNASSARSAYPAFLSVQETGLLQLKAAGKGLLDAFRWDVVVRLMASDAEVRANILKSLLLNVVSLTSIYFLDLLLSPLTHEHPHWLRRNIGWFYQILWLFPVMGASLYLNSSWSSQLANRTFALQHGSRAQAPATYSGILNSIATSAYRGVMIFTSVVVSFALQYIPFIGPAAGFGFMSWIDAYYCFEFTWIARGYPLARRLRFLEERWAYFLAFGLPPTALCMWGSTLANAAIFALVYPAFIIMAMHARPIPVDPYNPASTEDTIRHPSPYIPIRIPVFSLVVWLNDIIVGIIGLVGAFGGPRSNAPTAPPRPRGLSDSVESAEEGEAVPLETLNTKPSTRIRVSRGPRAGDRRKFD